MKKFLQDLISNKEKRAQELREAINSATTVDEVRSLGAELTAVEEEKRDAEKQLDKLDQESRGSAFDPMKSFGTTPMNETHGENRDVSVYASKEYRQAFMNYVKTGESIPAELRNEEHTVTTTADLGEIIPKPVMNEFIKEVSKVYGHIYSKVRKLNVKGGVKFPISKLSANFKWISETSSSNKQKAGEIKENVTFNYHVGEIRVAQTLLSQVVSLDVFEAEIVRIMVEAYVKAMDIAIIAGDGENMPLGITKDKRVKNVIRFTEEEFSSWTSWRKKLFAEIPLAKRGQGEFVFPPSTVEKYLLTMKDENGRPLFREATDLSMDNMTGKFFGRHVDLVEPDIIPDFDTAIANGNEDDDIIGIYWIPNDYAINTNLQFGMKRYFDEDTNEWINKGLTIVDGKILDTSGCYLLKKSPSVKYRSKSSSSKNQDQDNTASESNSEANK